MNGSACMRKLFATTILFASLVAVARAPWLPLDNDGLHDPENPGLALLQAPSEAMTVLPGDTAGNYVNWVDAIESGAIQPRSSVDGHKESEILDSVVLMPDTSGTPYVLFPHRPHSMWMSCDTCHDRLFKAEVDSNNISMGHILEGQHCGKCHGAVAFPLTECSRCHSVNPNDVPPALQPLLDQRMGGQ